MTLKVTLFSGEVIEFPVLFAHLKDGVLVYKRADGHAGFMEIGEARLVEFNA